MDASTISLIIIPPLCTGIGFLVKYYFDIVTKNKRFIQEMNLKDVEEKLEEFYFPLYINLCREELIWNKIISNQSDNRFKMCLDKEILETHLENQQIIKKNIIKTKPNDLMYKILMIYEEHITVFNILRNIDKDVVQFEDYKFPFHYGSPYPTSILDHVREELFKLKAHQTELYSSMV